MSNILFEKVRNGKKRIVCAFGHDVGIILMFAQFILYNVSNSEIRNLNLNFVTEMDNTFFDIFANKM